VKHPLLALALASLAAPALSAQAAEIEVMTQNQYVGTDLLGLIEEPNFNLAVIDALMTRAASLPTERVQQLARLIGSRNPALAGLQEVYRFTCVDEIPQDHRGCENPAIAGAFTDQLADTLAALGGRYRVAATIDNLNLPAAIPALSGAPGIPIAYDGQVIYVGMLDRDVILARKDVATAVLPFKGFCYRPSPTSDGCNYAVVAPATFTLMGQQATVNIERGFVGVVATHQGQQYRFVNTHLETRLNETTTRFFQSAQSAELLQYLGPMQDSKLLVVGDFNSDPTNQVIQYPPEFFDYLASLGIPPVFFPVLGIPPYLQMAGSGFVDVATQRPGKAKGNKKPVVPELTCCQDEDLDNAVSKNYERVDLIWSSTWPSNVPDVRAIGDTMADKTPPGPFGVWPSDHASVAARMIFGR
jgi:hypothetical protein